MLDEDVSKDHWSRFRYGWFALRKISTWKLSFIVSLSLVLGGIALWIGSQLEYMSKMSHILLIWFYKYNPNNLVNPRYINWYMYAVGQLLAILGICLTGILGFGFLYRKIIHREQPTEVNVVEGVIPEASLTPERSSTLIQSYVRGVREIKLGSPLETAILESLVDGRKSIGEFVELIYHVPKKHESYQAYYMRVRRAVKRLQARGLVSARHFGQMKPYRMTKYASEKLLELGTKGKIIPLIPRSDLAVYLLLALVTGLTGFTSSLNSSRSITFPLSVAMVFLTGFACSRIIETMRRVF